jgi:hypothetical protein
MSTRTVAVSSLLLALVVAGCSTPGETRANFTLQRDIHAMINRLERADGHPGGGRVVDTKLVSEEHGTAVEDWYVARGEQRVVYRVTMVPSPQGGTDYRVEFRGDQKLEPQPAKAANP